MATSSVFRRSAAAAAMVAVIGGVSSSALAAGPEVCLPGVYNPSVGIKQDDCYYKDELNKAMKDRGQKIIFAANQAVPNINEKGERVLIDGQENKYFENIFTTSGDGGEGYNIISDAPSGQVGKTYGIALKVTGVRLYNIYNSSGVPSEVNKGELGASLRKAHSFNRNVAMTAKTLGGSLVALAVDADDSRDGSLSIADSTGNRGAHLAAFGNVNYSTLASRAVGIKRADAGQPNQVALAPQ